eukprot:CAMPEP_0194265338 /NCGR_PEP_ID=MMETSP0169-20130528/617_1 /TAXON_ID=218684 /ORGANISM="Corethron pennatum, Strain L29A3" /LENGTH=313 /DNA_ID=CAMNT_0039005779 /DNA_START=117 /DNA_END=1058 /DNA_ORIENTATION=-
MKVSSICFTALLHIQPTFASRNVGNRALKAAKGNSGAKKNKGKKSQSSPYNGPLVAYLSKSPEYTGTDNPVGTATIRFNPDNSFLFLIDADGIDPDCVKCNVVVTDGASCDDPGKNFFASQDDPWATGLNFYGSFSAEGSTNSAFRLTNEYGSSDMMDKPVVVYDSKDVVIGCGLLRPEIKTEQLVAEMGVYPGYEGNLTVGGMIKVEFNRDDSFLLSYDLEGLEESCTGCGIHIHAGLSCDTHDLVMGHGWNAIAVQDLWTPAGGAIYKSNEDGDAKSEFHLYNGFNFYENQGHAAVIHGQDSTRIACGLLV